MGETSKANFYISLSLTLTSQVMPTKPVKLTPRDIKNVWHYYHDQPGAGLIL
jgi:hypothetical protein